VGAVLQPVFSQRTPKPHVRGLPGHAEPLEQAARSSDMIRSLKTMNPRRPPRKRPPASASTCACGPRCTSLAHTVISCSSARRWAVTTPRDSGPNRWAIFTAFPPDSEQLNRFRSRRPLGIGRRSHTTPRPGQEDEE